MDEVGALFSKRFEVEAAHDRYTSIDAAYLLPRMAALGGVTILTTSPRKNLGRAFVGPSGSTMACASHLTPRPVPLRIVALGVASRCVHQSFRARSALGDGRPCERSVTRFVFPGFISSQRQDLMKASTNPYRLATMRLTGGIRRAAASSFARLGDAEPRDGGDGRHVAKQPSGGTTGAGRIKGGRIL